MLEQRKRALTHNKRMQDYNAAHRTKQAIMEDAKRKNAFVLYDLKNIGML